MKAAKTILSAILFTVLCALTLAFLSLRFLGLGSYVVTGGSMEPAIHKGSLILVEPSSPETVRLGDVITFQKYDQTTSHRVIAIDHTAAGRVFTTKGDANTVADPEPSVFPGQVGLVRATIPLAGYAIAGVQTYWRLALALLAAVFFFGCAAVLMFEREQEPRRAPVGLARRMRAATVPVLAADAEAAWSAHLEWIERSRERALRVA